MRMVSLMKMRMTSMMILRMTRMMSLRIMRVIHMAHGECKNDDWDDSDVDDDNGDQGASGRRHCELEAVANHKHWRQEFHVVNR